MPDSGHSYAHSILEFDTMKIEKSLWEHVRLKIADLKPHPAQHIYDGTTSSAEDEALARDYAVRGQQDEIHVMPYPNAAGLLKGTVLDGQRRIVAATINNEPEIDAVIRGDLREATAAEVAAEFVKFNSTRRTLSPLARARCAKYLMSAEEGHPGWLRGLSIEKLKTQIGKQLGVDKRTVNRNLAILDSPPAVQQAYDRGEIGQVDAAKIGSLCSFYGTITKKQQEEISRRINAGEPAKQVIKDFIPARDGKHKKAGDAFRSAVKHMEAILVDLKGRTDKIYHKDLKDQLPLFDQVAGLLASLKKEAKKPYTDTAALAAMAKKMAPQGNGQDHFGLE